VYVVVFFLARRVTDGSSLRFSGDTVPTQKLVQAGAGATLLIHEATMADDQVEMARAKMHSTFGQAIDIGKRCVSLQYNHRPSLNL
jgi:ribonuclease BN (tRNA processing enzyme)